MTLLIRRGQRLPIAELFSSYSNTKILTLDLAIFGLTSIDFACFALDKQQKLTDDRYMTFYNQPTTPCAGVRLLKSESNVVSFSCDLTKLPPNIERLVFTAALSSGADTMCHMQAGHLCFFNGVEEVAKFVFSGTDFQAEKALMLGEIYRKDNEWRFSATGQGFNGGLAALVNYFGGEVADDAPPVNKLSLEKKIAAVAPKLIDLAKKATVSLEKHRLQTTVAHVGLVLDASGSMYAQYDKGKVQQVIERLLPLAVHFDDNGALDVWAFSNDALALPSATLQNYANYILTAEQGWRNWGMMSINNEPAVIAQVIQHYQHTKLPVFIIFVSDGGVSQNAAIKKLLVEAAKLPIFWQFVGIGGRNYGVLEKLDSLSGRFVDNCGFFALDDINSVSEQVLYERLLSEFPLWLEAAKLKNIL